MLSYNVSVMWQETPHIFIPQMTKLGGGLGTGLVVLHKYTCSEENKNTQYLAKRLQIILVSVYAITLCSN